MEFNPFENRMCRDIRNRLSENFVSAIQTKSLFAVKRVADEYFQQDIQSFHRDYIESRLIRYEQVLNKIETDHLDEVLAVALSLWDEQLFFEVHEYLEYYWLRASGEKKKILQAMIRAAGTYVHLEQGNLKGAGKMAAKSVGTLEANRDFLPAYINIDLLLLKLRDLDPVPPKLTGCAE